MAADAPGPPGRRRGADVGPGAVSSGSSAPAAAPADGDRRPVVAVGAVVVEDDHLLLVRRRHPPDAGRWTLPGGRVEWGEPLAAAVVRELEEETGLVGVCGELVGWTERITDTHHFVILDFRVTLLSDDPPRPGGDASEVAWVDVVDVASRDLTEGLAEFLSTHGVLPTII